MSTSVTSVVWLGFGNVRYSIYFIYVTMEIPPVVIYNHQTSLQSSGKPTQPVYLTAPSKAKCLVKYLENNEAWSGIIYYVLSWHLQNFISYLALFLCCGNIIYYLSYRISSSVVHELSGLEPWGATSPAGSSGHDSLQVSIRLEQEFTSGLESLGGFWAGSWQLELARVRSSPSLHSAREQHSYHHSLP